MDVIAMASRRMSVEKVLDREPAGQWQLVNGEAEEMAPARPDHGRIQAELTRLIGNHLVARGRRHCTIVAGGIQPAIYAATSLRQR